MHPIGGVYVLWNHPDVKQVCAVTTVSQRLQQERRIGGTLFVTGSPNVISYSSTFFWLKEQFDISKDESSGFLSDLLPNYTSNESQRVLFVIDQFDHLLSHPTTKSFLVSLAEDSVRTKRFNVIVCVTSATAYQNIIKWNGGAKINACARKY